MTVTSERSRAGRQSIQLVEMHLSKCPHTYGVLPCTAGLSVGQECYNTFETCQDRENYRGRIRGTLDSATSTTAVLPTDVGQSVDDSYNGMTIKTTAGTGKGQSRVISDYTGSTRTITVPTWTTTPDSTTKFLLENTRIVRVCTHISPMPADIESIPCVTDVVLAPSRIEADKPLSRVGEVTVRIQDFAHHDRTFDPYFATRTAVQGTFMRRLLKRDPHYRNRLLKIRTGFVPEDGVLDISDGSTDLEDNTYLIDTITGPNKDGDMIVKGKDQLFLTKKTLVPKTSVGLLSAALTDSATSFSVGSGEGAEYAASGTLSIGSEVMTYTRSTDTFTVVRGTDGTAAAAHAEDDIVQEAFVQSAINVVETFKTLFFDFTDVLPENIPEDDWDTEKVDWLGTFTVTGKIIKPTEVSKIIGELSEQYAIDIFDDQRTQTIVLSALKPPQGTPVTITDEGNIKGGSMIIKTDPSRQFNIVHYHYGIVDASKDVAEEFNFSNRVILIDGDSTSAQGFDESKIKRIYSRWATSEAVIKAVANRFLRRFTKPPTVIKVKLDAKDADKWTSDEVFIDTWQIQDDDGSNLPTNFQIVSVRESIPGTEYEYELFSSAFGSTLLDLFCYVVPTALNSTDYGSATDAEKEAQPGAGWICLDTGLFPDGSNGYLII